jgi:histidinol-phosphate aminotransferase
VHLGNPNNPTSSLTAGKEVQWLQNRLPKNTQLIVDEAYMDYVDPSLVASALPFVRQGANLIVTRTFSKLYGLAGARFGLACAPSELIAAMQPFRENVPGIVGARAAEAALGLGERFVAGRRAARVEVRESFCRWLTAQGLRFIPPTANFVLIEIPAPVAELIPRMLARGVAVGRRFDTFDRRLRLAVGTAAEMKRVEQELPAVLEELSRLGIR